MVILKQIQEQVEKLEQSRVIVSVDRFRGAGVDYNHSLNSAWQSERHQGSGDWRQPSFNNFRGQSNFRGRWNPRSRSTVHNNVYRQTGRNNEPDPRGHQDIEAPPRK